LYSYQNVDSYEKNEIVGFYQTWKSFVETFEESYLDYQYLCNITPETKIGDIGVSVIFYPLAIDISSDEANLLNQFIDSGGKVIISPGIGTLSDNLKFFLAQHGITVKENVVARDSLNIKHKLDSVVFELTPEDFYSDFDISSLEGKSLARWKENNKNAIGGTKDFIYLGYSWGQNADKGRDIETFLKTLDYYWFDISYRLTKEISKEDYNTILKEIYVLKEQAESVIKVTGQLDLPIPKFQLMKHFDDGNQFLDDFNSDYLFGNFKKARENANVAKSEFAIAYSLGVPVRKVEIRAVWLDRGTIVSMKNANELKNLIKKLAKTGFNVIFFETVNAGYPVYPSKLLPQNPLIKNWDPLQVAIEAAHLYGMELHAWVWVFAVGNTRHNLLIDKPVSYAGPILETKGRSWALASQDGKLRIETQPETWISPANKKACEFLKELFTEIVTNYNVDGLQLDYIRFPFQKTYSQTGFDFVTKTAFKEATGYFPQLEGPVNRIWKEWKVKTVNEFVRDVSTHLKNIKPNLKISGAVFGLDRSLRLQLIQQDWETWLINKWVDAVYPFYYSYTKDEIRTKLVRERQLINDQSIIIPGFNLRTIGVGELAERISTARNSGVLGVALFATEHLDTRKEELLRKGPFREETIIVPYNDPLLSCQKLLEEFSFIIDKFVAGKSLLVLADSQTRKDVYYLTQELKNDFKNFTPEKSNDIEKKLTSLQLKVKDWLSLEKYLDRDERAVYISTYLDQVRTLLHYMGKVNSSSVP